MKKSVRTVVCLGIGAVLTAVGCSAADESGEVAGEGAEATGEGTEAVADLGAGESAGELLVDITTAGGAEVSFVEHAPGVIVTGVVGELEAKVELPEGTLVEQYRALAGAAATPEAEAILAAADERARELNAAEGELGELASVPFDAELDEKYYNPNVCNPASTYWTNWFRTNKCTNGGDFGSGWWIDNWPAVCNSLRRGYTGVSEGWFVVNFDAVGPASCTDAYLMGYGHLTNTFPVIASTTMTRGHWYAYRSTRATQSWRLEGDDGQCRQTQLHACFLAK